jgi:hypothetical protein
VLVLMLLLVLLAAIGLGPERPGSLGPAPTPPRFEAAVADSVALAPLSPRVALVAHGVAVSKAQRSAGPIAHQVGDETGGALAVSPAQAVAIAEPTSPQAPVPVPEAQPVSAPAPELVATPEPASAPVVATSPSPSGDRGGSGGGPISAGVEPEPVCEGDEYTITAVFLDEGEEGDGPRLEIILQRRGSDGSSEELRLEGDLADVQSLVVKLSGEGGCVTVEIQSSEDETVPPEVEAGLEAASSGDSPEPPLP